MSRTARRIPCALALFAVLPLAGAAELRAGDSPWYVEAKAGRTSLEARFGVRSPKTFDDEASSRALEVGYSVNRYLAVQAGFHDLGEYTGFGTPCPESADSCIERLALCVEGSPCTEILVPVEADVEGFSVAAIPRWPVGDRLLVFGRLGVVAWETDVGLPRGVFGGGRLDGFSGEDLVTGLGARWTFPRGLGVLVEHQRFDLDLGSTSVGLSYQF